jgi:hypothetical protein
MGDVIRYDFDGVPDPCAVIGIPRPYGEYVKHMHYAALIARHNELVEAVAWEREFDEVLVWLVQAGLYPRDMAGKYDLGNERECARSEVDRLIANESAANCKGEG